MENQKVWLPDPVDGYVLGIIEDIHQDSVTAKTIRHPQRVSLAVHVPETWSQSVSGRNAVAKDS